MVAQAIFIQPIVDYFVLLRSCFDLFEK